MIFRKMQVESKTTFDFSLDIESYTRYNGFKAKEIFAQTETGRR